MKGISKFQSKPHAVCGQDNIREDMMYVYFEKDKIYATDAHKMLVQDMSLHNLEPEVHDFLNGKRIHASAMALTDKAFNLIVVDNKLMAVHTDKKREYHYRIEIESTPHGDSKLLKNSQTILKDWEDSPVVPQNQVIFNVPYLLDINRAFVWGYIKHQVGFVFKDAQKVIKVYDATTGADKQYALFMPSANM